ncbi:MAG: hypothetical protein HFG20_06270 [Anaerotruncus sp.]|nr:hypothetical protein [Anaerotruncus sp.]
MKINAVSASAYGVYAKNPVRHDAESSFQSYLGAAAAGRSGHTDKISISSEGARQLEIDRLTKAVMDEIQTPTPAEKLEQLSASVRDGSYQVSTEQLTGAIMSRWFGL